MPQTFLIFLIIVATATALTCNEILEFPQDRRITLQELEATTPKDVVECLAHLGREKLPDPEAEYIWKSIIKYYGGIVNIPESTLVLLHWITVAVTPEDYENITLNSIDVVQNFGLNYNLNDAQMSAIANRVREDFSEKEPEDYTYYDLTALRQILCAFNRSDIERIPPSSYREAALLIGKLEGCNAEVMTGFATLAVQRRAFGSPDTWTEATIKILGKVADYLPKDIVENIKTSQSKRDS